MNVCNVERDHCTSALIILMSSVGLSVLSVATKPIRLTTVMPDDTRPKMECLPSNHCVGPSVMKN